MWRLKMPEEPIESLVKQYDDEIDNYIAFTEKIKSLVAEILKENNLIVHSVTARAKDRDNFIRKISSAESKYLKLNDITDLSGIRIITYFEDEVDKVAEYISQQFEIDWDNSVDKRATLDPDRFGYLSLHLIVKLLPERARLIEYRRYPDLKAELQIRSILQHAWAEIEHDLGYKTKLAIPAKVRRSFSRLAGLLEIADKEFISLKNELSEYERLVPEQIISTPQTVLIDKASLKAFISYNNTIIDIDKVIAEKVGAHLVPRRDENFENDVALLFHLGIRTIGELNKILDENRSEIIQFADRWLNVKYLTLQSGISLLYLFYIMIGSTQNIEYIREMLDFVNIPQIDNGEDVALKVLQTSHSVMSNQAS